MMSSAKVHCPGQRWPALASSRLAGHRSIADAGKLLARYCELARHGQSINPGHLTFFAPGIGLLALAMDSDKHVHIA
jgi:hypothetical protein